MLLLLDIILLFHLKTAFGGMPNDSVSNSINSIYNLDNNATVPELIKAAGYPVETHTVTTADGYILTLHRIPSGKKESLFNKNLKKYFQSKNKLMRSATSEPVFLQHGLLSGSACWVLNSGKNSAAFALADEGYDVWLGNARGNKYSRKHTKLSPDQKEFWGFSWDEMAKFDIPAVIDYILNTTKHKQLSYVGHSMGTTMFYAAMSENPEYNSKIKVMFGLGPVAFVGKMISPIRFLAPFVDEVQILLNLLGEYEFLPDSPAFREWKEFACAVNNYRKIMCENTLFFLVGFDSFLFNKTLLPMIVGHEPEGTSTNTVIHYAQMVNKGNFQHFDYGLVGNMEHYGQAIPPPYNLSRVTCPTIMLWANNDWLADPKDAALLAKQLPNLQQNIEIPYKFFNHLDFLWATNAYEMVNHFILKYLPFY